MKVFRPAALFTREVTVRIAKTALQPPAGPSELPASFSSTQAHPDSPENASLTLKIPPLIGL